MSSHESNLDILLVGAGTMGLAIANALAVEGQHRIGVLDRCAPPHREGAHHGHTRLIRVAYGEGDQYVRLARRAHTLWQTLDQHVDGGVFHRVGVANIGDPEQPFLREVANSARLHDLPLTCLSADEAMHRFPGWRLDTSQRAYFEPDAGVLLTEPIINAWRRSLETSRNVAWHDDADIVRLERNAKGYTAIARDGRHWSAERLILSAGRAVTGLGAQLGLHLPLQRVRKVFAWFDADSRYTPLCFPGFSFTGSIGDYYGFPDLDDQGFKVGRHDGGQPVDADEPLAEFGTYPEDLNDLLALTSRHLPGVGALREGAVCEYIRTPDEDFLIDEAMPGLFVACGFSGHGFKFAPAIGEALGHWLTTGERPEELAPFTLERFR